MLSYIGIETCSQFVIEPCDRVRSGMKLTEFCMHRRLRHSNTPHKIIADRASIIAQYIIYVNRSHEFQCESGFYLSMMSPILTVFYLFCITRQIFD